MADNFNLRQFLSENKLTKNAKLLKEGSDYGFEALMDAADDLYPEGTPENGKLVFAIEKALHSNSIDTSEFGHDLSAATRAVEAIANEIGLGLEEETWEEGIEEEAPSTGLTAKEKSAIVKKARHGGDIGHKGAGFEKVEKAAEKKYGSKEVGEKVAAAAMWKAQAAKHEGVHESTLTDRERRLVEMVENALDLEGYGDDNVKAKLEKRGEAPVEEPTYTEGEEMVTEKPLPKYESIEELMKEIEHGTNEAAHKYKMDEMKRIYEALEAKVTSLEEGENAEHIDQKKVKQMRKDIAALRKAEEKLRKEFDKKFAGKEKKEAPKKEKEDVTLA